MTEPTILKTVAIVCGHVAKGDWPILRGDRTDALEPEDSGWQFLCNSGEEENPSEAEVWTLGHVLKVEPSLEEFLELPADVIVVRKNQEASWQVISDDSPPEDV